jgi:hypothetical protein
MMLIQRELEGSWLASGVRRGSHAESQEAVTEG